MQIKNWQIAFIGNIIQILAAIVTAIKALEIWQKDYLVDPAYAKGMALIIAIFSIVVVTIFGAITLLLYKDKTQKIGARFSIVFSLIRIYLSGFSFYILLFIPFLIAGINFFWKLEFKKR